MINMEGFKVLKKKTVYKSEKVQVDTETISLPNGNTVDWDVMVQPDFYCGVTIVDDKKVLMSKEWRQGPHDFLTQFTVARAPHEGEEENLSELKRELKEELGVTGGQYEKVMRFAQGTRLTGFTIVYLVTDFTLGETHLDENEIQKIVALPIKGLYDELSKNHIVTSDTLLIAKLLEERYSL